MRPLMPAAPRLPDPPFRAATTFRVLRYLARQPVQSRKTVALALKLRAATVDEILLGLEAAGLVAWSVEAGTTFLHTTPDGDALVAGAPGDDPTPAPPVSNRPLDSDVVQAIRRRGQATDRSA